MHWEDERYVRFYTRDTTDWLALSWKAQGLFGLIMRKVDRVGVLELGKAGKRGLAVHIGGAAAWAELEPALDELIADGCVQVVGSRLLIRNFIEAQEAKQSDKARQRASRERARDVAKKEHVSDENHEAPVTNRDSESHAVTSGHAESHGVTPAVLSRAVPSQPDPPTPKDDHDPVLTPPEPTRRRRRTSKTTATRTTCPASTDSDASSFLERESLPSLSSDHGAEVARFLNHHSGKGTESARWIGNWGYWKSNWTDDRPPKRGPAVGHEPPRAPIPEPTPPPPPTFIRGDPPKVANSLGQLLAFAAGDSKK